MAKNRAPTEADWSRCRGPRRLAEILGDRLSWRKKRLFCVACCRRLGDAVPDEPWRRLLLALEAYSDDTKRYAALEPAVRATGPVYERVWDRGVPQRAGKDRDADSLVLRYASDAAY